MKTTKEAFKALRRAYPTFNASHAIAQAREALSDAFSDKRPVHRVARYGYTAEGAPFGGRAFTVGAYSLVWVERPEYHGMRDCGDAHKLTRLGHTGWYIDSEGRETATPCVYRWGRFYIPAIRDPHNTGPVMLAWEDRVLCRDASDEQDSDNTTLRDCARAADGAAEAYGENCREYSDAWEAGSQYAREGEEMQTLRKEARELIADMRKAQDFKDATPTICRTLRSAVSGLLAQIQECREKRAKLAAGEHVADYLPGFYTGDARLQAALNDGAGCNVFTIKGA
jgi:hypothetical protein